MAQFQATLERIFAQFEIMELPEYMQTALKLVRLQALALLLTGLMILLLPDLAAQDIIMIFVSIIMHYRQKK